MSYPFQAQHGHVSWPAVVVHGGAGAYAQVLAGDARARGLAAELGAAIAASLDASWQVLDKGGSALAAVVAAVTHLEDSGRFNAGPGSVPTTAGGLEMDAAVMDEAGRAGAVACVSSHSPIRAAEAVFRHGGPVLMAGPHADAFAARCGVATLNPVGTDRAPRAVSEQGTVGAVAVSVDGRFAAATSTGGRAGQLPGRVGDTPIPGAGLWAQPGCAVSATGTGEAFILAGFSRLVAHPPRRGATASGRSPGRSGGGRELRRRGGWDRARVRPRLGRRFHHRSHGARGSLPRRRPHQHHGVMLERRAPATRRRWSRLDRRARLQPALAQPGPPERNWRRPCGGSRAATRGPGPWPNRRRCRCRGDPRCRKR
jgi:L-asparaginase / beta-aspartyl-peptidase